jgi:hypothetical protein
VITPLVRAKPGDKRIGKTTPSPRRAETATTSAASPTSSRSGNRDSFLSGDVVIDGLYGSDAIRVDRHDPAIVEVIRKNDGLFGVDPARRQARNTRVSAVAVVTGVVLWELASGDISLYDNLSPATPLPDGLFPSTRRFGKVSPQGADAPIGAVLLSGAGRSYATRVLCHRPGHIAGAAARAVRRASWAGRPHRNAQSRIGVWWRGTDCVPTGCSSLARVVVRVRGGVGAPRPTRQAVSR